jgi:hypothetical protein
MGRWSERKLKLLSSKKRRSAQSGLNREPDQAASLQSFFPHETKHPVAAPSLWGLVHNQYQDRESSPIHGGHLSIWKTSTEG